MPAPTDGRIKKYLRKRKFKKAEVLRVFAAVMESQNAASGANASGSSVDDRKNDYHNEFFNTGRIGRRNALPDILGYNCTTTTADLPSRLSALTTDDTQLSIPSTSGTSTTTTSGASLDRNAPSTSQASCSSSTQPVDETMNAT